jgi:DNA gyrase inhibitor GyrI
MTAMVVALTDATGAWRQEVVAGMWASFVAQHRAAVAAGNWAPLFHQWLEGNGGRVLETNPYGWPVKLAFQDREHLAAFLLAAC